jgi:hypothetical protein
VLLADEVHSLLIGNSLKSNRRQLIILSTVSNEK